MPDLRNSYLPYRRSHLKHEMAVRGANAALWEAESEDPDVAMSDAYSFPDATLAATGRDSLVNANATEGDCIISDIESGVEHGRSG